MAGCCEWSSHTLCLDYSINAEPREVVDLTPTLFSPNMLVLVQDSALLALSLDHAGSMLRTLALSLIHQLRRKRIPEGRPRPRSTETCCACRVPAEELALLTSECLSARSFRKRLRCPQLYRHYVRLSHLVPRYICVEFGSEFLKFSSLGGMGTMLLMGALWKCELDHHPVPVGDRSCGCSSLPGAENIGISKD